MGMMPQEACKIGKINYILELHPNLLQIIVAVRPSLRLLGVDVIFGTLTKDCMWLRGPAPPRMPLELQRLQSMMNVLCNFHVHSLLEFVLVHKWVLYDDEMCKTLTQIIKVLIKFSMVIFTSKVHI